MNHIYMIISQYVAINSINPKGSILNIFCARFVSGKCYSSICHFQYYCIYNQTRCNDPHAAVYYSLNPNKISVNDCGNSRHQGKDNNLNFASIEQEYIQRQNDDNRNSCRNRDWLYDDHRSNLMKITFHKSDEYIRSNHSADKSKIIMSSMKTISPVNKNNRIISPVETISSMNKNKEKLSTSSAEKISSVNICSIIFSIDINSCPADKSIYKDPMSPIDEILMQSPMGI